jgi:type VII secretion protein EccB
MASGTVNTIRGTGTVDTMWNRREQHQAYRFLTRRIVSAMLSGEPETNELPLRRFTIALIGGVAVAVLVVVGVGVYGLLFPGGARPTENTIIVERESGAKYVYLQGQLHPVLNWASARLIIGKADPPTRTMSAASLRDVPRGRPVGIASAPDALPDKGSLVGLPWSVCSAPRSPSSVAVAAHVLAGTVPAGGVTLGEDEGVLASDPDGLRFLIWRDHRLLVPNNAVLAALGWTGIRPAPVALPFLDALPPGPDLAPLALVGAGGRATATVSGASTTIGQLFRAGGQYYVMTGNGLAPVGDLTVRLLIAAGAPTTDTTTGEVGRVLTTGPVEPPGLPQQIPTVHGTPDRFAMACAVYRGSTALDRPVTVQSFAKVPDEMTLTGPVVTPVDGTGGVPVADRVAVPGGRGALVAALTSPGSTAPGSEFLVTDQGIKYQLPRTNLANVATSLGYGDVKPLAVPASILALIPTGPALDPQAAALFEPPPTAGPSVTARPSPSG